MVVTVFGYALGPGNHDSRASKPRRVEALEAR